MDKNIWSDIKTIFYEAISLDESQRESFVNKVCKTPEIKQEVLSLLSAHNNSENYLEQSVVVLDPVKENISFFIGKLFGKYKIVKLIARGGMGLVYLGQRDDEVKQQAAVKIIGPGFVTESVLKRFRNERQTLANLNHPNISKLLDAGITDDGIQFLVMEYIDGIPVDEYCDKNNLTIKERMKLFLKIASVVQYAHHNLVIHRDLKPSNILVTSDGEPKLLDFGIAKILDKDGSENDKLTIKGIANFTPEYASPEQVMGESITTASDVYSLGIVLYKLLTGHNPYKISSSLPTNVKQVVTKTEPPKPSDIIYKTFERKSFDEVIRITPESVSKTREGSIEKLHKKLSGDIDNIVSMSIRKEPERRYPSIDLFAEDIERYLNDQPVSAHKDSFKYKAGKFFRRNKGPVITGSVIAILIMLGIAGIIWQSHLTAIERDNAKLEARKANEIKSFLLNMISSPDPGEDGKDVKMIDVIHKAAGSLSTELQGQKQIEAEIRTLIGNTYLNLGIYDSAAVELNKALKINNKIFGERSLEAAKSIKDLGQVYHYEGDFETAEKLYLQSLDLYKSMGDKPSLELAKILDLYATLLSDKGEYEKSEGITFDALKMAESINGPEDNDVLTIKNNLATAYNYDGKLDKADSLYRICLSTYRKKFGNVHIRVSSLLNNLAFIYIYKKEHHKALPLLEESVDIKKKVLGEDHPDLILAYSNLGSTYFNDNQFDKAEKIMKLSVEVGLKNFDENNENLSRSYMWYGRVLAADGKTDNGILYLKKAYFIRKKDFGQKNKLTLTAEITLAKVLLNAGKLEKAENHLLQCYKISNEYLGRSDKVTQSAVTTLIELYTKSGRKDKAELYNNILDR